MCTILQIDFFYYLSTDLYIYYSHDTNQEEQIKLVGLFDNMVDYIENKKHSGSANLRHA